MLTLCLPLIGACAAKREVDARSAWETAEHGPAEAIPGGGVNPSTQGNTTLPAVAGWQRVERLIVDAVHLLATQPALVVVTRLAKDWCAVEPTPQPSTHGEVEVCEPEPPVIAGGHTFTIELGAAGVVGLVAAGLSGTHSERLVQYAREQAKPLCRSSWTTISTRAGRAHEEFATCALGGGPILAVGRFPRDLEADLWQVSIAVLNAS